MPGDVPFIGHRRSQGKVLCADGRVTVMPSFMHMSTPMGLEYFRVFDDFFGTYSTKHLAGGRISSS
jgi:hypothetical protein